MSTSISSSDRSGSSARPSSSDYPVGARAGHVPLSLRLVVRWSGLVLAIGLAAAGMWVEAAVAMLVALGQVLAWRWRLPWVWEVATSVTALVAAISSYLFLYERWSWWDLPVHFVLTAVVSVLAAWMFDVGVRGRRAPRPWLIVLFGAGLAWVWEMLEWWGHHAVDPRVYIAPLDTVGDVIAGLAGATVAAWWWRREAHRAAAPPPTAVSPPSAAAPPTAASPQGARGDAQEPGSHVSVR
ncbi:hypothetical protein M3F59_09375 [Brachybacterium muris]|uniref:hypothetical protein n=1 Tax=Brachybacterium muris TaxID=219301 RepID=UPI00223C4CB9|nr:hypothetical protein [Brachybacterium muris]MCT2261822.1 hypothetical protein [Brachybacterium muris]